MEIFKSRYNVFQVLLFFIGAVLFLGALSLFTFSIYLDEVIQKGIISQIGFLIFACGIPCFISLYALKIMLTSMPVIGLLNDRIEITNLKGKQIIYLSEIKKIIFTKVPFRFIVRHPLEGILILTKNNTEIYLHDLYYFNSHRFKWILSQFIDNESNFKISRIDNIQEFVKNSIKNSDLRFENFINYKGLWWLTFQGLGFIIVALIPFAITVYKGNGFNMPIGVYVGLIGFLYLLFGYQLHYFKLSDNFLIATNHLWIWKQKKFRINEINEIVFEQSGNLPVSLRIITKDFKTKLFPAASLRNKTWRELQKLLNDRKISTRKETHF